jgi:signal transduction histidine kinase
MGQITMDFEIISEEDSKTTEEPVKDKDAQIEELKQKLYEAEQNLNNLKRSLEQRVIERTVEVKRLLLHKTKFIDHLSHDLGTPLTPMLALLPIIKQNLDDPKLREMTDTCIRNAEYIKRVVRNAQELADLGTTDLFLKKENLLDLIKELVQKYDVVFKSCNIQFQNSIDEDIFVKTEKNRLIEVFDHAISNAVNSMLDGGTLIFDARNVTKKDDPFVEVLIKDTGTGLERDQLSHIFDEFYKTDNSRHKLDSTGLGLSICKTIVEKHGGKIWAASDGKGAGTIIHFTIPSPEFIASRSF